jgi:hypothetical protein
VALSRNAQLANKIAQAASSFADRVRCGEGDEPDGPAVRAAFDDLFQVWLEVEPGLTEKDES